MYRKKSNFFIIMLLLFLAGQSAFTNETSKKSAAAGNNSESSQIIRKEMSYQGVLTDNNQNPVSGTHTLTFRIYDAESGSASLWEEIHPEVNISEGIFQVFLGSNAALDLPFNAPYWLSIQIDNEAELTPRMRLASSASSFHSQTASLAEDVLDNVITSEKIADGAIQTVDLAFSIPTYPVTEIDIADGAISSSKIANNAVSGAQIQDSSVQLTDLAFSIPAYPVTEADIADGAISSSKIANNAVSGAQIQDSSVQLTDLAFAVPTYPVTTPDIAENAITGDKIADNSIGSAQIQDNAISSSKLADNAVTSSKIAADAISSEKIAENAVTSSEIAADAVNSSHLLDEPGLAHSLSEEGVAVAAEGVTNITSQSITVPGPGIIVARSYGYCGITGTTIGTTVLGIETTVDSLPEAPHITLFGANDELLSLSLTRWGSMMTERIFQVNSGGTFTYYLNAARGSAASGDATIWYGSLTLLYFPTSYGVIQESSQSPTVNPADGSLRNR